jgi:hypothetical protein
VRDAICDILYTAAISIRTAANAGDARYCAVEANHVHNLPSLLKAYSAERLRYYLDAEVPRYLDQLAQFPDSNPRAFEKFWDKLRKASAA